MREWLASQAAGGYVTYDENSSKFSLSEEQAFALAAEDSPAYLPGAFELALGSLAAVPRIAESFRTGPGWVGMNMLTAFSMGVKSFSGPAMPQIS